MTPDPNDPGAEDLQAAADEAAETAKTGGRERATIADLEALLERIGCDLVQVAVGGEYRIARVHDTGHTYVSQRPLKLRDVIIWCEGYLARQEDEE